jgi:hypothetical protein
MILVKKSQIAEDERFDVYCSFDIVFIDYFIELFYELSLSHA